ncbi:hypothetical protein MY1884_005542 [Beauveria asiatica]
MVAHRLASWVADFCKVVWELGQPGLVASLLLSPTLYFCTDYGYTLYSQPMADCVTVFAARRPRTPFDGRSWAVCRPGAFNEQGPLATQDAAASADAYKVSENLVLCGFSTVRHGATRFHAGLTSVPDLHRGNVRHCIFYSGGGHEFHVIDCRDLGPLSV